MTDDSEEKKLPQFSKDGSIHVTDEVINTVTHMTGSIFSLLGMVLLIVFSAVEGKPWHIVSFSIYGLSLMLLFLASSFHHGLKLSQKANEIFRQFDYFAIFILIAGTYTPLCLVINRSPWGWSILGVVWTLAAIGITIKAVFPKIPGWVSHTLYISMGWVGAVLIVRSISLIGSIGFVLILSGGIVYTIGAGVYYFEKPNPVPGKFGFHEIWHLFVLTGAALHFIFMYFVVLPF